MLFLWAKREMLVKQIGRRKWRRHGVIFAALAVEEAKSRGVPVPTYVSPETPGVLTQLTDHKDDRHMPLPFFISDDFLKYADRRQNPRNKCSLWLTMLLYDGVVQNFTHFTIPSRKATKLRGEIISDVFGVRDASREHEKKVEAESADDMFE